MSNVQDHPLSIMRKELEAVKKQVIKLQDEIRTLKQDHLQTVKANLILTEKITRLEDLVMKVLTISSRLESEKLQLTSSRKKTPKSED